MPDITDKCIPGTTIRYLDIEKVVKRRKVPHTKLFKYDIIMLSGEIKSLEFEFQRLNGLVKFLRERATQKERTQSVLNSDTSQVEDHIEQKAETKKPRKPLNIARSAFGALRLKDNNYSLCLAAKNDIGRNKSYGYEFTSKDLLVDGDVVKAMSYRENDGLHESVICIQGLYLMHIDKEQRKLVMDSFRIDTKSSDLMEEDYKIDPTYKRI